MKRWTLRILVFLLLGAIVNVAVAWGCALQTYRDEPQFRMKPGVPPAQWEERISWLDVPRLGKTFWSVQSSFGVQCLEIAGNCLRPDEPTIQQAYVGVTWAGWPNASLVGEVWMCPYATVPQSIRSGRYQLVAGWQPNIRSHDWYQYVFPLRPIWPGFAINTVFYAVILWLLFAGPFMVRRWRRIRRGLCPKCAYDLRGTDADICAECGASVPKHKSRKHKA